MNCELYPFFWLIMIIIIMKPVCCNGKTLFPVSILKPCISWSNGLSIIAITILIGTLPSLLWKGNDKVTIRRGRNEAGQSANPQEQSLCNISLSGEDIASSVLSLDVPVAADLMPHILSSLIWEVNDGPVITQIPIDLSSCIDLQCHWIHFIKLVVFLTLN